MDKLIKPPNMAMLNPNGQFVIGADAFDKQVGYVLQKEQKSGKYDLWDTVLERRTTRRNSTTPQSVCVW